MLLVRVFTEIGKARSNASEISQFSVIAQVIPTANV